MVAKSGQSQLTISRIWRAFLLQPQRSQSFQLSNDPLLVEKVRDIVGLYMNPPDYAVVLCVGEKSQILTLSRNQPVLPMQSGHGQAPEPRLPMAKNALALRRARRGHQRRAGALLPPPPLRRVP